MISDPTGKLRKLYKVSNFMSGVVPLRVTFVILPDRTICFRYSNMLKPREHVVQSLQAIGAILREEQESMTFQLLDPSLSSSPPSQNGDVASLALAATLTADTSPNSLQDLQQSIGTHRDLTLSSSSVETRS